MSTQPREILTLPPAPSAAPEVGVWLAALSESRGRTLEAVAGIAQAELDWVCPLCPHTIGSLLYHIAVIEFDWLYSEILEREFPADCSSWFPHDVRDAKGVLTRVTGDSIARHLERLQYVRDQLNRVLSDMSISEFRRVRHLKPYDVNPEWVVHHLLQHEAHHRGQISILRARFADETK
jgi:uncharacterized damage-inducible protein DinB